MNDRRNVLDEFKDMPMDAIIAKLDKRGVEVEIAIENLKRDFNMGTIVRTANAFGIRKIHIIGSKQWNKRGAMMTDKYLTIAYYPSVGDFSSQQQDKTVVAVDNVRGALDIRDVPKTRGAILVFGAEGPGLSEEMMSVANTIVEIPQIGSTRSINVGVAAGIAMWEWLR